MDKDVTHYLVHDRPSGCPQAKVAIGISDGLAEKIKRDPLCMACGKPALKAIPKATCRCIDGNHESCSEGRYL